MTKRRALSGAGLNLMFRFAGLLVWMPASGTGGLAAHVGGLKTAHRWADCVVLAGLAVSVFSLTAKVAYPRQNRTGRPHGQTGLRQPL